MTTINHCPKTYAILQLGLSFLMALYMFSCESFLEVEDPFGQISDKQVFENEELATAAMTTVYSKFRDDVLLAGTPSGISVLMGLYSDELDYYGAPNQPIESFYQHQIIASNSIVESLWNSSYNLIYRSNSLLEGIDNASSIPLGSKNQLKGEALFARAMIHFYLTNLFGDIPYVKTRDYQENSQVTRTDRTAVYKFIVDDLLQAKTWLSTNYMDYERVRPNQWVATALLARVYLYQGSWELAEQESNSIINHTALFQLETELQNDFLKESRSTIWQLRPRSQGINTNEASTFIFNSGPPPFLALSQNFMDSMDDGDLRKTYWTNEVTNGVDTWYYPYKYKYIGNTGTSLECSKVFRLSEQYLIRAEARAMQNNISGALDDINTLHSRAGLSDLSASSPEDLRALIFKERNVELFTEHGHRWFDMKRMEYAEALLAPLKPGWTINNIHLPIPEAEILINPNLNPQNAGY